MKVNDIKRKFISLAWREDISYAAVTGFKMYKLDWVRQVMSEQHRWKR